MTRPTGRLGDVFVVREAEQTPFVHEGDRERITAAIGAASEAAEEALCLVPREYRNYPSHVRDELERVETLVPKDLRPTPGPRIATWEMFVARKLDELARWIELDVGDAMGRLRPLVSLVSTLERIAVSLHDGRGIHESDGDDEPEGWEDRPFNLGKLFPGKGIGPVDARFDSALEDVKVGAGWDSPPGKASSGPSSPRPDASKRADPADELRGEFDRANPTSEEEGWARLDAAEAEPDPAVRAWRTVAVLDTPLGRRVGRNAWGELEGTVLPPIPVDAYAKVFPASGKALVAALSGQQRSAMHVRQATDPWWGGALDGKRAIYAVDGGKPQASRRPDGTVVAADQYPVPIMRAGGKWEIVHLPYEKKEKPEKGDGKAKKPPAQAQKSAPYAGKKPFPKGGVDVDLSDVD